MMNHPVLSILLPLILGLVYPLLFIWAVNTLFSLGIPFTFKNWLASLVLFLVVRFFLNKPHYHTETYDDYYGDASYEDEEEDEEDDETDIDDDDDNGHRPEPHYPNRGRMRRIK